MSYQHTDEDVEQCIKAEIKTLYPEEYERVYGKDEAMNKSVDEPNNETQSLKTIE